MKIPNKRELQQIAFNYSSSIDFKDFMNLCKMYRETIFFCQLITQKTGLNGCLDNFFNYCGAFDTINV